MTKDVQCCRPDDSLELATQMMWDHDCGCLPVCTDNGEKRVVGMLTDRDIALCALFEGMPLRDLRVSQAMAKELRTCLPSQSLADAEKIMSDGKVRRLPVLDKQQGLVGIISLADLAQEAAREQTTSSKNITDGDVSNTLAAICTSHATGMSASA
ncbi:CBS domain-containing protein [Methyloterricola oryzae]|uniref:CBS domain-containing protein n=1 Tax=Methyloterricola oryzae TaxID=1495050 RepID=UPI0013012719|nr:CBS domain-containing protein [Methyloterricola oryzae]